MRAAEPPRAPKESFCAGLRTGAPFALAGGVVALSFGVSAEATGLGAPAAILMSLVVFAGSAQFAAVGIVAAGGGLAPALAAAALVNSRFLPMGVALAPYLPGGAVSRAIQGQPVVDTSWALAQDAEGRFDRHFLFGATAVQWVTWQAGTVAGALVGTGGIAPQALGLDAVFPAFFLVLLTEEVKQPGRLGVAVLGAAIALVLVPFTPPGVPVLVASVAAFVGLRRHARAGAT